MTASSNTTARHDLLEFVRHSRITGSKAAIILATFELAADHNAASALEAMRTRVASAAMFGAVKVVTLNPWVYAVAVEPKQVPKVRQSLGRIADFMEARGLGRLTCEPFVLPDDTHRVFAAVARESAGAASPAANVPLDEARARDVDALIAIERMLRTADIENLVRERPVYDFAGEGKPVLVQNELVVDLAEIGRIAGYNIRKRPWLLSEVTRLLDGRVLAHIMREPTHRTAATAINLHCDTVLGMTFQEFLDRLDTEQAPPPCVELDYAELKAFPEAGARAVEHLRAADCRVTVDGIPARHLAAPADRLPAITGSYKFDWRNSLPLDAAAFDAAQVAASIAGELDRLGRDNCVLLHCHAPPVIERALAIGFTRLEGFEITRYLEKPARVKSARAPASAPRRAASRAKSKAA